MSSCSSRERVEAALAMDVADHPPTTLWRHWPGDDQDSAALAEATLGFQREFGFDLVKITPSASFMSEAWGATTTYTGDPMGVRDYSRRPVLDGTHWAAVREVDPLQVPSLRRELEAVRLVRAGLSQDVPLVVTVFTPLSVARYLCGEDRFLSQVRMHRAEVGAALRQITATCVRYVREALAAGADGIYLSAFPAAHSVMSEAEYRDLAGADDVAVLEAAQDALLRILHFHLPHPLIGLAKEYPANMVGWEHTRGGPSLQEGMRLSGKAVIGGLDQFGAVSTGSPQEVRTQVQDVLADVGPRGLLLSSSCSVPTYVPHRNLRAVVDTVRGAEQPCAV